MSENANHAPKIQTILYATDLGKHTRPVFRYAVDLAKRYDAKIVMLHAIKPLGATSRAVLGAYLPDLDIEELQHEGEDDVVQTMRERLKAFCRDEGEACSGKDNLISEFEVRPGMPAEVILNRAVAHKADLVVLGSCTHSLFGHHSLGSTTRKVTQHSTIPVLVVPNAQV